MNPLDVYFLEGFAIGVVFMAPVVYLSFRYTNRQKTLREYEQTFLMKPPSHLSYTELRAEVDRYKMLHTAEPVQYATFDTCPSL